MNAGMSTTLQKCVAPKLGIMNKYKQIINDNTDCMMTFTSLQTLQYFEFIVERFVHLLYAVLGSTIFLNTCRLNRYFHLSFLIGNPEDVLPSILLYTFHMMWCNVIIAYPNISVADTQQDF